MLNSAMMIIIYYTCTVKVESFSWVDKKLFHYVFHKSYSFNCPVFNPNHTHDSKTTPELHACSNTKQCGISCNCGLLILYETKLL